MPLFEFVCANCDHSFEELVRSSNAIEEVKCPVCGSAQVNKKVSRIASRLVGGNSLAFSPSCSTGST